MFDIKGKYTDAVVMIDNIESECLSQIISMVNDENFTGPIRIMPDTHSGKGSVIGFTMPIGDRIVPEIVGVDIGCGMLSFNIGNINLDLSYLDEKIRELVPFGHDIHEVPKNNPFSGSELEDLCKKIGTDCGYILRSIGTLGGGNHFIEVGIDENNDKWITIHSGSRYLGKKVCEYWQRIALDNKKNELLGDVSESIEEIKRKYDKREWSNKIKEMKDKKKNFSVHGLVSLKGDDLVGYLKDMKLCQEYAVWNRYKIFEAILDILELDDSDINVKEEIETIHNYVDFKDKIIRKGAIRSYIGEKCVIPFNMRDGLLICEGKSNSDWNFSAPHGAGRILSRGKAKKELNVEDFIDDMEGIYSTSVCFDTLDESPRAYKDSKIIEECIEPTVKILHRVKPIHNMKSLK